MLEPELKEEIERLEGFNKYNVLVGRLRAFRFVQDIDEDERDTRLKGTPKCLIGRIFADFKDMYSPNGNLLKPFKVPTDWPVVAMIDWHPSERQAIAFMGVDKIGNDYQFGEVWEHLGNER